MNTRVPTHPHPVLQEAPGSQRPGVAASEEPDHERARSEAEALWAALARARSTAVAPLIASAEDAVFQFYQPLALALAAGSSRSPDPTGSVHAAELGLAQAVLSWHGSEAGFLRFASGAITGRLHRSSIVLPMRRRPRTPTAAGPVNRQRADDVVRRIY